MQVALTKKLADAIGLESLPAANEIEPLFSWTANWTNTFQNRKEDMIVMINNANRFTVCIYGVKRNQFKNIIEKMNAAIRNTLTVMNVNPEIIDEYMKQSGEIQFYSNKDSKLTAQVNGQGLYAARYFGRVVNEYGGEIKYNDAFGHIISDLIVGYSKGDEGFIPAERMKEMLSGLYKKPIYKYRAFEILVSLKLIVYTVTRRLIIPAEIKFYSLHKLLQSAFGWQDYHLHDFEIFKKKNSKPVARVVVHEESLYYDKNAVIEDNLRLSDYFPENKYILYTYDMGDNWAHHIELIRTIEDHNEESPFLLEAIGKTPPEDVGGIGGFAEFLEIINNPTHPDYERIKEWAGKWSPELHEWDKMPRVIHYKDYL